MHNQKTDAGTILHRFSLIYTYQLSSAKGGIYLTNAIVGRGHDPADQVAHFALARFNESAFVSLRFGGVMTPPYEWRV